MTSDERELSSLERQIALVLRVGLEASATVLGAGLALMVLAPRLFPGEHVIQVGLMLLISVPIVRIGASFVDARRRHDRLLTWATATVLAVMAVTLAISLAGR